MDIQYVMIAFFGILGIINLYLGSKSKNENEAKRYSLYASSSICVVIGILVSKFIIK